MPKNPYLSIEIKSLRSRQNELSAVKQRLTEDVAEVALLRNFFKAWATKGYFSAVAGLPDDNPATPKDESVSVADIKNVAEQMNIDFPNTNSEAIKINQQIEENLGSLKAEVRRFYAKISSVNSDIDAIDSKIEDLTMLQKSEASY